MPYPNWITIGHGGVPRLPPRAVTTAPDAVVGRSPSAGAVYRRPFAKRQLLRGAGVIGLVLAAAVTAYANQGFFRAVVANYRCCGVPMARNAVVALKEAYGQTRYFGEIGQDKWNKPAGRESAGPRPVWAGRDALGLESPGAPGAIRQVQDADARRRSDESRPWRHPGDGPSRKVEAFSTQ